MRTRSLLLLLAFFFFNKVGQVRALDLEIVIAQVGPDVVATGTGSLSDLAGLTLASSNISTSARVTANQSRILVGGAGNMNIYNGLSVSGSLGTGSTNLTATSGTGLLIGMNGSGTSLWLQSGYVAGTQINSTATWTGTTLATLGLTPGSVVNATWNSGGHSMRVTVQAVPEPSTIAMSGLATLAMGLVARRRYRSARLSSSC